MRGADFSEVRRKDVWSIPLEILREVVINVLVHAVRKPGLRTRRNGPGLT